MTSIELFNLISKPWASVNDIKKIASCGRDNAILIRDFISKEIIKSGKYLPKAKEKIIPMKSVIEYLNLDVEYISEMAKKENELRKGGSNNGSL